MRSLSEKADVLLVMEVPVSFNTRGRIAELATVRRIPTLFWGGVSDAGVLVSYGTAFTDTYPKMPLVVDKIFKGAKLRNMVARDCHHEDFYTGFVAPCHDAAFERPKG